MKPIDSSRADMRELEFTVSYFILKASISANLHPVSIINTEKIVEARYLLFRQHVEHLFPSSTDQQPCRRSLGVPILINRAETQFKVRINDIMNYRQFVKVLTSFLIVFGFQIDWEDPVPPVPFPILIVLQEC